MLVDLRVLFKGWTALMVAFVLTVVALIGKWLAAALSAYFFKYSRDQMNVLFGLTSAHAAATIAVIMVGYNLEIIDENVLNGTILLILVTCLVASFVTERSGRRLAMSEAETSAEEKEETEQAILTTIKNPDTLEPMLDLAILLKAPKSKAPIYALRVIQDNEAAQVEMVRSSKILEKAMIHAAASDTEIKVLSRLDVNPAGGITRAAKETMSGYLLLGWRAKLSRSERIFGSTFEQILLNTDQTLLVCNLKSPLNTVNRLIVAVPPNAEREKGFHKWKRSLSHLAKNLGAEQLFYCSAETRLVLQKIEAEQPQTQARSFQDFEDWDDFLIIAQELKPTDLLVIVNARSQTISHNHYLEKVPSKLAKHFDTRNFLMIYPEQHPLDLVEIPL